MATNPTEHFEDSDLQPPDLSVGLQRDRIPVTTYLDAYYWTCWVCGWLGTGLSTIDAAQAEAGDHFRKEHEAREVYIVRKDVR